MLACLSFRAGLICALIAILNTHAWSQSRHLDVTAVDEHERPLIEATVMVTLVPEPPKFPGDEMPWSEGTSIARVFAQTDASGAASVDVSQLDRLAPNQPMRITVWKKGYGPQTVAAQIQARVRCVPVIKRHFQIVDSDQRPVTGVKVQQLPTEAVAAEDQAKMVWWTDNDARTNQFGVVALDSHANGSAWFEITAADGVRHQTKLRNTSSDGSPLDPRDLAVVRLSRYAKIEGRMPAEFAKDYVATLIPKFNYLKMPLENSTRFDLSVKLQADGSFIIDAVPEGDFTLVVRPKPTSDTAKLFQAGKAPQQQHQIQVLADKTISLAVNTVSLAKVTGRLATKTSGLDLSSAQVNILQDLPPEPLIPPARPKFVHVPCSADGSFECWLPPGRYEIGCVASSLWKADKPLSLEVGAGAANISAGQLQVSPTKQVKVAWQSEYRMPTYLHHQYSDSRLVFSFKGDYRVLCNLTQDGYGQILVPVGGEATGIHRNVHNVSNPRPSSISAFVDTDPSENYKLELDSELNGVASNISIRGRVVDALGNPVANVPVHLALLHSLESHGGMRGLEWIVTEADGSFLIPPRQFLDDIMRGSPQELLKGNFKFSAFVQANPEPVEVQKVITFDSQAWELKEIEFPDLVLEPRTAKKRLSVQLLDANGQPAAGEFIQLADQRRLLGALSDEMGRFAIEDLTGPTWLLRSSDWSVRKLDNYDQPLTLALDSGTNDRSPSALKQRMPKEQRQSLTRKILQAVPKLDRPHNFIDYPYLPLSDEAYLSPDASFRQVETAVGPEGDADRLQYAKFWHTLGDEKLERLLAAMGTDAARIKLLRLMADRKPSAEAYARVLDAIPMAGQAAMPSYYSRDTIFEQIAQVGLKLHHQGQLDPHREKIRQFVEQWKATKPLPRGNDRPAMTNSERKHSPVCLALADPEKFARETLELMSKDTTELTYEDRDTQSSQARVFLQLYPNDFEKLSPQLLRISLNQETMISWGEQTPLSALQAYDRGKILDGQLRQVVESSLLSRHTEAGPMVRAANKLLVRTETPPASPLDAAKEIEHYKAARTSAPDLGRQMAWFMARDYLGGRYEFNPSSILPTQDQLADRALAVAYCLRDEYPELAGQIVKLGVPRVLNNLERQFDEHYRDTMDMTLVAWFEPQATCDLLIKLSQRYAEELQKKNAQPPAQPGTHDYRMLSMTSNMALLRHSCLRGLLLDELEATWR